MKRGVCPALSWRKKDGLRPSEVRGSSASTIESLFWRDPRREPVPGVSLDDVLDGACPQLTLSVHCDSALNPVAVAYAPPSSVCEVDAPATATPSDGAFTYSSR